MKRRLFLFFIFALLITSGYATAGQVRVYPLTKDLKMIPYPIPQCSQIDKITELYYKVNDTYWIAVVGPIKIGCPGVDNISVEILGVKNVTIPQYNLTLTLINTTVKTGQREYRPLGLSTRDITIEYRRYNETYELVTVKIENMKMYWSYAIQDYVYHNLTPEYYGFPSNITINLLINRKTGEGYLLDNGRKRYVGVTPLWDPALNPSEYPHLVLRNLRNVINQIKANPWIVENVIQKAKLSKNISESSGLLSLLALNLTNQVMSLQVTYLGREMYLEGFGGLPLFTLPVDSTYLIRTYQTGWGSLPTKIDNISSDKYVKKVLTDYLKTRDDKELKRLIVMGIFHKKVYLPPLIDFDDVHHKVTAVSFTLPPSRESRLLVLPLPHKYAEAFNASYLMLNFVGPNSIVVKYDPTLYTPEELISGWKEEGTCMNLIRSTLVDDFTNTFSEFEENGTDVSKLDKIYSDVVNKMEQCGFNVSEISGSPLLQGNTTSPASTSSTSHSIVSPAGASANKKKDICGPAFLVPLALIPAWLWRKRK
jgi:hypothetical protein